MGEVNIREDTVSYNQIFTVTTYFIVCVLIVMLYFIIKSFL